MKVENRLFISKWLPILLGCWVIGIALKFLTFQIVLNQNLAQGNLLEGAIFPYFPNVLDSAFIIVSILYLVWRTRK